MHPIPLRVDISADTAASLVGLFRWDTSSWDGGDVWAGTPRWVTLPSSDVRAVSLRRGRAQDWTTVDAGELTVVLADHGDGGYGLWDPSSPYRGEDGSPAVKPGMMVRLVAEVDGGDVILFTGELDDATPVHGHVDSVIEWTVLDLLARLGRSGMDRSARSAETSSARATWCMGVAGIPAAMYSVPAGGRTLMAWDEAYASARTVLERITRSEAGRLHVTRAGVVTLTWHSAEAAKSTVLDFSDDGTGDLPYSALVSGSGALDVVNAATVTRPDGRSQDTTVQTASAAEYGRRDVEVEAWVDDDPDVKSLANFYSYRRMRPAPSARQVDVAVHRLTEPVLAQLLALELGDRVSVRRTEGLAVESEATVEAIMINAAPSGMTWSMATLPLDVSDVWNAANGIFTWDSSSWDGGDVWGYFY